MKSLKIISGLMLFNVRLLSWRIWLIVALASLVQWLFAKDTLLHNWSLSSGRTTDLGFMWILYCAFVANLFFEVRGGSGGGLIPHGEFILIRPLLRRTAYFTRISLYFILILAAPLAAVVAGLPHPDLRIIFSAGPAPDATAELIKFYQNHFPDSSLSHDKPRFPVTGYAGTLVIPSGALLVAWWNLFVAVGVALILQLVMLFKRPSNDLGCLPGILVLTYCISSAVFAAMFPPFLQPPGPTLYEYAFFFFAQHPVFSWLFTLEAFLFVQWMAVKRIKGFEAI